MTRTQLLENVKVLPRSEQIDLALDIWEAIDPQEAEWSLTHQQKEELDRRLVADETNPQPAEGWPALRKKILRGDF
jgi:putative addiction module component (TIGR02574 family)